MDGQFWMAVRFLGQAAWCENLQVNRELGERPSGKEACSRAGLEILAHLLRLMSGRYEAEQAARKVRV